MRGKLEKRASEKRRRRRAKNSGGGRPFPHPHHPPSKNTNKNSGARFQRRAAEVAALATLLSNTDPPNLLVPSRNFPGRLFCVLTCHLVNAKPAAVASHLAGKKLAAARKAVAAGELEPMSEPDMPTDEEEEEGAGPGPASSGGEEEEAEEAAAPAAKKGKGKAKQEAAVSPAPATPAQVADEDGGGGGAAASAKRRAGRPSRPKRTRKA